MEDKVVWLARLTEPFVPRVVIVVRGGVAEVVGADADCRVTILNFDDVQGRESARDGNAFYLEPGDPGFGAMPDKQLAEARYMERSE